MGYLQWELGQGTINSTSIKEVNRQTLQILLIEQWQMNLNSFMNKSQTFKSLLIHSSSPSNPSMKGIRVSCHFSEKLSRLIFLGRMLCYCILSLLLNVSIRHFLRSIWIVLKARGPWPFRVILLLGPTWCAQKLSPYKSWQIILGYWFPKHV